MAALTTQTPTRNSENTITYASAAGGGDTFVSTGKEILIVRNGDASPINVTLTTTVPSNHGATANKVFAVAAGAEVWFPFPDPGRYRNASGNIAVGYSAVTDVTVAVVRP
jgi:hypothetical protein